MNKDSSIVVTGGSGFLGSYILRYLLALGFTNIRATRRKTSNLSLIEDTQGIIKWLDFDLREGHGMYELLDDCEFVIHAAAKVSFDAKDADALYLDNVQGTANLVNAAIDKKVNKFIHISSIAALGRKVNSQMITEETDWEENKLSSNYARSKYLAEMEVWRGQHEGISTLILNPSLILGGGFWSSGSIEIVSWLDRGLRFYPMGATGIVDVRDVAMAAILSLVSPREGERMILNGDNFTYKNLFETICKHLNCKAPSIAANPILRSLAIVATSIGSVFGRRSNLSRETIYTSSQSFQYSNQKSIELLDLTYIDGEQCLREMCELYRENVRQDKPFGVLPLHNLQDLFMKVLG